MVTSIIFPENIILQFVVFIISSVVLLLFTKPLINKFTKKDAKIETNAYSIIGKKGIIIKDINSKFAIGQVKINNEVWSAKADNETILEEGTEVKVIRIDGVKAVVEPIVINSEITK